MPLAEFLVASPRIVFESSFGIVVDILPEEFAKERHSSGSNALWERERPVSGGPW